MNKLILGPKYAPPPGNFTRFGYIGQRANFNSFFQKAHTTYRVDGYITGKALMGCIGRVLCFFYILYT